ncbi:MAG: hypothetical protein JKY65_19410 [Planctomycetes bacterium]|nr:hypothetical protein [Planctomycetota bacterium]
MRNFVLACLALPLALFFGGCAGGEIIGVSAANPDEAVLTVSYRAKGLAHVPEKCHIVARWGPFNAVANAIVTGSQPVSESIDLTRWQRIRGAPASDAVMEIWFTYPNPRRPIDKKTFPPPFSSIDVIEDAVNAKSPVNRGSRPASSLDTTPSGWGRPEQLSGSLDSPSSRDLSKALICQISAGAGPRYFKVNSPPNTLVRLTIDVHSKASAGNVNEATWWRVSLLDEAGMALPQEEQEFVGLGQEKRHEAEWMFDGSPVIFKLASGSKDGDWIRIRFETVQ